MTQYVASSEFEDLKARVEALEAKQTPTPKTITESPKPEPETKE